MIPQELIAAIGKLLRDMPRNPTAIEVGEALKAWIAEEAAYKHNLYRHYDIHGALLYVGISINAINRLGQHKTNAHWFGSIQRVEIQKFKTDIEARDAERAAISNEKPAHNVLHNRPSPIRRSVVSTPVVSTSTGGCPDCERRRKSKNQSMKKWRSKTNADPQKS